MYRILIWNCSLRHYHPQSSKRGFVLQCLHMNSSISSHTFSSNVGINTLRLLFGRKLLKGSGSQWTNESTCTLLWQKFGIRRLYIGNLIEILSQFPVCGTSFKFYNSYVQWTVSHEKINLHRKIVNVWITPMYPSVRTRIRRPFCYCNAIYSNGFSLNVVKHFAFLWCIFNVSTPLIEPSAPPSLMDSKELYFVS